MFQRWTQMFMDIIGIDLFDQNVGTGIMLKLDSDVHAILLVLIYLIKMWVWHVPEVDTDVHGYHWY